MVNPPDIAACIDATLSTVLPQEADGGRQLLAEAVDLLKRADETEAGPGRRRHAVMAVQGLTAVVATADADP